MMNRLSRTLLTIAVAALTAVGCGIDKTVVPALSGPSELSLSLQLTAQPSILTQDGVSQSVIDIQARDANGQPARNIVMRAEILANSPLGPAVFDFGRLSTKAPVTDQSGHAIVRYTAPPRSPDPVDNLAVVTILVTPETGDSRSNLARQIDIRLVPPGVVLPPNGAPVASFNFSPSNPVTFSKVHFVSTSVDDGQIVSWAWNFGDGGTATGSEANHTFEISGSYNVVLTVTDDRGLSTSSDPVVVSVSQNTGPTANFTFSPVSPVEGDKVFFNASSSTASEGHEIVSYKWNLGTNNGTASGITVSKVYNTAGAYTITLTVTDDSGQTNTTSQTLNVFTETPTPGPTAQFTFSPIQPAPGTKVTFNASASTSSPNTTLVAFEWDFGDSQHGNGKTTSHTYNNQGTFTVTLTVTDSLGQKDSTSQTVLVSTGGGPTASFTFSPTVPIPNQNVFFNASASSASQGASLVTFDWDFGDGFTGSGKNVTHPFSTGGPVTVVLTVTDSFGQTDTTSQLVTVATLRADFTFSPTDPKVNNTVSFNATVANTSGTVIYDWDFGDNTAHGSTQSVTHQYTAAQTFTVVLTVTDNSGSVIVSKQFTVAP